MEAPAQAPLKLVVGRARGDRVEIDVLRRDGDWLETEVEVFVGAWRGRFAAMLNTYEFADFRRDLGALYGMLLGEARFKAYEGWLSLTLTGDGRGHVVVEGTACDDRGIGNELHFGFHLDQTDLPSLIARLDELLDAFPVLRDDG